MKSVSKMVLVALGTFAATALSVAAAEPVQKVATRALVFGREEGLKNSLPAIVLIQGDKVTLSMCPQVDSNGEFEISPRNVEAHVSRPGCDARDVSISSEPNAMLGTAVVHQAKSDRYVFPGVRFEPNNTLVQPSPWPTTRSVLMMMGAISFNTLNPTTVTFNTYFMSFKDDGSNPYVFTEKGTLFRLGEVEIQYRPITGRTVEQ